MKKYLSILLVAIIVICAFAACSKAADDKKTTSEGESSTVEYVLAENEVVTDKATIKNGDAANFIKTSYTVEELGLKDASDYSFMEHKVGLVYNDKNYVVVEAMVKTVTGQNEAGEETFSLDSIGTYLISFDGQEVLMKSGDTYKELENRYADYQAMMETSTAPSDVHAEAETTKAQ